MAGRREGRDVLHNPTLTRCAAVDGATGRLLWQYTPKVNFYGSLGRAGGGGVCRESRRHRGQWHGVLGKRLMRVSWRFRPSTGEKIWESNIADPNAGYSEFLRTKPTGTACCFIGGALGDSGLRGFRIKLRRQERQEALGRTTPYRRRARDGCLPGGDHGRAATCGWPITVDTTDGHESISVPAIPAPDFDKQSSRRLQSMG